MSIFARINSILLIYFLFIFVILFTSFFIDILFTSYKIKYTNLMIHDIEISYIYVYISCIYTWNRSKNEIDIKIALLDFLLCYMLN